MKTETEHKQRHELLHRMLDELVAHLIDHSDKLPSKMTVAELLNWSAQQAKKPSHPAQDQGGESEKETT